MDITTKKHVSGIKHSEALRVQSAEALFVFVP